MMRFVVRCDTIVLGLGIILHLFFFFSSFLHIFHLPPHHASLFCSGSLRNIFHVV